MNSAATTARRWASRSDLRRFGFECRPPGDGKQLVYKLQGVDKHSALAPDHRNLFANCRVQTRRQQAGALPEANKQATESRQADCESIADIRPANCRLMADKRSFASKQSAITSSDHIVNALPCRHAVDKMFVGIKQYIDMLQALVYCESCQLSRSRIRRADVAKQQSPCPSPVS
jgi:hypothetical protein